MMNEGKAVPNDKRLEYHGTAEKPDIKIFVSNRIDQNSVQINNPLFIPVRCGAVFDNRHNVSILGDDTGVNISSKKDKLSELTVLYWAWKNIDADYYGLCHYRRYFSFDIDNSFSADIYSNVVESYINQEAINKYFLSNSTLQRAFISKFDIIFTRPYDVTKAGYNNLREQFLELSFLTKDDLAITEDIIREKTPKFYQTTKEYLNGTLFYPCCMFIMKRKYLREMCEWIFSVIDELFGRIDLSNRSKDGQRTIAHIAERLIGAYYYYKLKSEPELKTCCLQRVLFFAPEALNFPVPFFQNDEIPVVYSCSEYYVPFLAVSIKSLVENSSDRNNYDIIILHVGISAQRKDMLLSLAKGRSNIKIRFFDIGLLVNEYQLKPFMHVSIETYYRLIIHYLFGSFDKIIYLDSDVIVLNDVAQLYNTRIGNNLFGSVKDPDFAGEYTRDFQSIKEYVDDKLDLSNPYDYVNTGVVLFNIKEMRKTFGKDELISLADKEYRFGDQDILNSYCKGRIFFLDERWNVLADCFNFRIKELIANGPQKIYSSYLKARENPFIIHYAGGDKPWENPEGDYAEYFWQYARMIPGTYETILKRMDFCVSEHVYQLHNQNIQSKQSIVRKIGDKVFPLGSKRRKVIKTLLLRDLIYKKSMLKSGSEGINIKDGEKRKMSTKTESKHKFRGGGNTL